MDREPEERRSYPRRPSESEARQDPFPHDSEAERPQDGLGRAWWRRIFRGPHEGDTERPWWWKVFGG